jgi:hypothetical protein
MSTPTRAGSSARHPPLARCSASPLSRRQVAPLVRHEMSVAPGTLTRMSSHLGQPIRIPFSAWRTLLAATLYLWILLWSPSELPFRRGSRCCGLRNGSQRIPASTPRSSARFNQTRGCGGLWRRRPGRPCSRTRSAGARRSHNESVQTCAAVDRCRGCAGEQASGSAGRSPAGGRLSRCTAPPPSRPGQVVTLGPPTGPSVSTSTARWLSPPAGPPASTAVEPVALAAALAGARVGAVMGVPGRPVGVTPAGAPAGRPSAAGRW